MLFRFVFLLVAFGVTRLDALTLSEVCSSKQANDNKVDTVDAARNLLRTQREGCSSKQLNAFEDLQELLEPKQPVEACSIESVKQIEQFHLKHIAPKDADLPRVLREFFVGLAMKLHQHCIKRMVEQLPNDESLLQDADRKVKDHYLRDDSLFRFSLKKARNFDDLSLVSDIIHPDAEIWKHRRVVEGRIGENLIQLYQSCKNSFRPIYERRVLPVIKLARLGYEHLSKEETNKLGSIEHNSRVSDWYDLTLLCDALLLYEILPNRYSAINIVRPDRRRSTFSQWRQNENEDLYKVDLPVDGEEVLNDGLFIKDDQGTKLASAIKSFKAPRDLLQGSRDKFVSRLSGKAKSVIMKRMLKNKIFGEGKELTSFNFDRLIEDLNKKKNPTGFSIGPDDIGIGLFCLVAPPLCVVPAVQSYRNHKRIKERDEEEGLHVYV